MDTLEEIEREIEREKKEKEDDERALSLLFHW